MFLRIFISFIFLYKIWPQQVQNEECQTYWAGDYWWRHRHRQETGQGWRCHAAAPLMLWPPTPLPPYLTTTGTQTATRCTSGWCRPGHWSTWVIEITSDRLSIFWKRYASVFLSSSPSPHFFFYSLFTLFFFSPFSITLTLFPVVSKSPLYSFPNVFSFLPTLVSYYSYLVSQGFFFPFHPLFLFTPLLVTCLSLIPLFHCSLCQLWHP